MPDSDERDVESAVAAVRAAFGTDLVRGRLGARRVRMPATVPRLPADLGVRGVIGLDDLPRFAVDAAGNACPSMHVAVAIFTARSAAIPATSSADGS